MARLRIHRFLPIVAPVFACAFALVLVLVLAPAPTDACENAVLATEQAVATVKEAEKLLNEGDPAQARRKVKEALGGADEFDERIPSAKGLTNRAMRILSLADVRIDDRKGDARKAVLNNAIYYLSEFAKNNPNDAAKQTDYGEALAKTNPPKAKKILEDLASRDIVTTPYAYAALARLRAADGDDKGRDDAMGKCKKMAKVESICEPKKAKPSKS